MTDPTPRDAVAALIEKWEQHAAYMSRPDSDGDAPTEGDYGVARGLYAAADELRALLDRPAPAAASDAVRLPSTLPYIERLWTLRGQQTANDAASLVLRDYAIAALAAAPAAGGEDWLPIETAPKSVADGSRVSGVSLLGFVPDEDAVDPSDMIDVIWWEPLLPNNAGGRGKWVANRFSDACEVQPTHWRPLPAAPAARKEPAP